MIRFENTDVWGWGHAVRGMRNPMNSWEMSDSQIKTGVFSLGDNDKKLAEQLIRSGPSHRKFLRQIFVSADITAPLYWWKEFDTYKIGTTANSCSTMHKIHAREFALDDFSCEHLSGFAEGVLKGMVDALNLMRNEYNETHDKDAWWAMIQLLPESYNQRRTVTMDYENLLSIREQRKNHKLDEWHAFIDWTDSLPYAELLCVSNG